MSYTIMDKCDGCGACKRICPADAISGDKKAVHTIMAAACIECGVCGRVCLQGAVLDQNRTPCVMIRRSEWLMPVISLKSCMACTVCVEACPVGCLVMSGSPRADGVDTYPYLKDEKSCIGCSFCSQECPVDAVKMKKK